MSVKECRRLRILSRVESGQITLTQAAEQLALSYRQCKRLWQRFKAHGAAGLVHRLRGRPGNRRGDPALRRQVVGLYRERYDDFGLTLACEYLRREHGLAVDDATLGRWLRAEQLWRSRRKSPSRHRRRERRPCLGELVQIDGSHHDWFEGRAEKCVLMVMIDDATNRTWAQFYARENALAAMDLFRQWSLRWGLPLALYPDRHSIYWQSGVEADEVEERTGRRPLTQFGRALQELGVGCRPASTPQAKGRVERRHGLLQDRLVKAMRLSGIRGMTQANVYLREHYLPALNAQFEQPPAHHRDAHLPVDETALDRALCLRGQRVVGRDHCVSFGGRILQLDPGRGLPSLAGKRVLVEQLLNGALRVMWKGQAVSYEPVTARTKPPRSQAALPQRVAAQAGSYKPPKSHPWRARAIPRAASAC